MKPPRLWRRFDWKDNVSANEFETRHGPTLPYSDPHKPPPSHALFSALIRGGVLTARFAVHHCFGGTLGYMACATHGATLVLPTASFDEKVTLQAVRTEKCEALYGVPTMFAAVLDELARERNEHGEAGWTDGTDGQERKASGFENLRTGIAAGSSVPATLMRRLARDVGLDELTICYGMTETSPVSAMTARDDPWERRVDSVGKPLPHVAVKVVDREDRSRVLDCDERGELAVSGYLVMEGYWGDEERTKEVMGRDEEGRIWMHVSALRNQTTPQRATSSVSKRIVAHRSSHRRATKPRYPRMDTSASQAASRT